jgi:NADPH:quinone reductase-like Zn-dependent oxidoreductase
MKSLVAPHFTSPAGYILADLPTPVPAANQVLIRVHAASINPYDIKRAEGLWWMTAPPVWPFKLGLDVSGMVEAVGKDVSSWKKGDAVFAELPRRDIGSCSEFVVASPECLVAKPTNITHSEAASLGLVSMTALHALERFPGGAEALRGKTVFVAGGLSGCGSMAVQMLKNVFGAAKVITTVSTAKVGLVEEYLGKGVVDTIVDYTRTDPVKEIGRGTVDFVYDPIGIILPLFPLLKPDGLIITSNGPPSSSTVTWWLPTTSYFARFALGAIDGCFQLYARWSGVHYAMNITDEDKTEDLRRIAEWVGKGLVRPVVGTRLRLEEGEMEKIKETCELLGSLKGSLGKTIIEVV